MHNSFAEERDQIRLGYLGVVGHDAPSNWRDRGTSESKAFSLYLA